MQTDAGTTRYISGSGCAYQDGNTRMIASGISALYMQLDALSQQ